MDFAGSTELNIGLNTLSRVRCTKISLDDRFCNLYNKTEPKRKYAKEITNRNKRFVFTKASEVPLNERFGSNKSKLQHWNGGLKSYRQRQEMLLQQMTERRTVILPIWMRDDEPMFTETVLDPKMKALSRHSKYPMTSLPLRKIGGRNKNVYYWCIPKTAKIVNEEPGKKLMFGVQSKNPTKRLSFTRMVDRNIDVYHWNRPESRKVTEEDLDKELEEYMFGVLPNHLQTTFPTQEIHRRNTNFSHWRSQKSVKPTKEELDQELEEYMSEVPPKNATTTFNVRTNCKRNGYKNHRGRNKLRKATKDELDKELEEYMSEVLLYP